MSQPEKRERLPGEHVEARRTLLLGKGWFPEQLGGLDRMYRDLFESLPLESTTGLVVGPATDRPPRMHAVSRHDAPLWRRIGSYWRAANRLAPASDVLDAHFALYAFAPTLAGRTRRMPMVVHFQGPWAAEVMLHGDGSRIRYMTRRAIERRVYSRAARILVLTSAFKQELVTTYGMPPWDIEVVPPGVDLERFTPGDREAARKAFGVHDSAFLAVCTRRLVSRMGLDHLLEAWRMGLENGLPEGSALLIAGDGPLRERLESKAATLGLGSSTRFLGRISDVELLEMFRAADVNIVPTTAQEGFGLVVLEAAACGTPSIVTAVGGLPEAVDALDESLVVQPADPEALARRMVGAHAGALPGRGRTRAYAEGYSWEEMAGRRRLAYQAAASGARDERFRVVYLDHIAKLSGGELALLRLIPHMQEVNSHVILFEDGPLADRLRRAGISVEILPLAQSVGEMRKDDVFPGGLRLRLLIQTGLHALRLARRLRQIEPDLVHTNSLKSGVIGSLAAKLAGIPTVWHLRDRLAPDYLPRPVMLVTRFWMRLFSTSIIANSEHTAETIAEGGSWREVAFATSVPDVSVVPSAIPMRSVGSAVNRQFTVGMVGRLAPWKGQDVFLRAFAKAFPNGSERAVLVGSAMFGENEFADRLRELAVELGISERVEWRGFVEDVPGHLPGFDVLVHASRVPEPFGQVILEGLAAAVPVVAADDGGPSEILVDGQDGLLCPPGDVDAYARAFRRLRDNPALRARLVGAGLERVKAYSPKVIVPQVLAIYDAVREGRRSRARST